MTNSIYSIGTVSELTGVKSVTLRAWERRYGLLQPKKTETGRRVYTDDDVVRIKEVLFWLNKGVTVSKVNTCLQHKKRPEQIEDEPDYSNYQRQAIEAVKNFDQVLLDEAVSRLFSLYPLDVISQKIYPKVLEALSGHWLTSDTAFSEQQFFSFYLRNKIATQFLQPRATKSLGKILVSTLDEAFTELELLFLSAALSNYGFEIVLLGTQSLPHEWSSIVQRIDCLGLVLSIEANSMQIQQVEQLATLIDLPICVRTRSPLSAAQLERRSHVHWLPENYHQLLATIYKVMTE